MSPVAVDDIVTLKKPHPCGSFRWKVLRTGADYKLACEGCGHIVLLDSETFRRRLRCVERPSDALE